MMVKALKTECRKAESKWRKTKLQIHHDLYKISLCNENYELVKARQRHFSGIIKKNINNTRTLFAMVDKLTGSVVTCVLPKLAPTFKSCLVGIEALSNRQLGQTPRPVKA